MNSITTFNTDLVDQFFNNLELVINRENISPENIWTMNKKVVAKLLPPISPCQQILHRKNNILVAVSAMGMRIPSYMSTRAGNVLDLDWMKHFINHIRPLSNGKPSLLLLDNNSHNMSIETATLARLNKVHLLSFPAHCSSWLQPLEISVFGPMKRCKNNVIAQSNWMSDNPGKQMGIKDILEIIDSSLNLAVSSTDITAGFKKAGIMPFNRNVFHAENDYAGCLMTERTHVD